MANSSIPDHNTTDDNLDAEIEHHNNTLPLIAEEMAEVHQQPSLAEQFKEMGERIRALETSNTELRRRIQAKRITMRSTVVIPDEEPSH